jgi:hypothetical protein
MIAKEKHPIRVLFFRDHEISGLGPGGAGVAGPVMGDDSRGLESSLST